MGETCIVVLRCINSLNGPNTSHMVTLHTLCPQVQDLYLSPGLGPHIYLKLSGKNIRLQCGYSDVGIWVYD